MSIQIISNLVPKNGLEFFLLEDIYLKGGLQVRADTTDRDTILADNRKEGMFAYTVADGKLWVLQGGITNGDWVEKTFGGGSPTSDYLTLTAAEAAVTGALVHVDSSGEISNSQATTSSGRNKVNGVVRTGVGAPGAVEVYTADGLLVPILFDSVPLAVDNGKDVFLHTDLGEATLTPPASSGNTVVPIGTLQGADGVDTTPDVLFRPQPSVVIP